MDFERRRHHATLDSNCPHKWTCGQFIERRANRAESTQQDVLDCYLVSNSCAFYINLSIPSSISTSKAVQIAKSAQWSGRIAGTRKTTPGFRLVEKYALLVGGADVHRMDLSSMIMIKDNHMKWIKSQQKSLCDVISGVRLVTGSCLKVEVETSSLNEALEAAQAGADIVMLDHVSPTGDPSLGSVCRMVKTSYPNVTLEASGNIRPDTGVLCDYLIPELDLISMGCLTQDAPMVDMSFKLT